MPKSETKKTTTRPVRTTASNNSVVWEYYDANFGADISFIIRSSLSQPNAPKPFVHVTMVSSQSGFRMRANRYLKTGLIDFDIMSSNDVGSIHWSNTTGNFDGIPAEIVTEFFLRLLDNTDDPKVD